MNKRSARRWIGILTMSVILLTLALSQLSVGLAEAGSGYQLQQVVVLSRHNIRAPLSNSGSAVAELTPHTWTEWSAPDSELTLKGGVAETLMGQYFRKWLESEGLFPEDYIPAEGEIRFYANARQRTIATARYFAAGCLPLANVDIEHADEIGAFDPVFKPVFTFMSDAYKEAVINQIKVKLGLWDDGLPQRTLASNLELLADVLDFEESHGFESGEYAPWVADDISVVLEEGKETSIKGSIKTAYAAGDALVLQYYEMDDARAAAFDNDLTFNDWSRIADVTTTYQAIRYSAPLVGINVAHPMLMEILSEMQTEGRRFTFLCGHDSNVATVLSALGVTDYRLPETIEKKTPIGVKLLFETWSSDDGEAWARVRLVYPSTEQLRALTPLTLDNPPMSFDIELHGMKRNADGYYCLADVYEYLRKTIDAYDVLVRLYGDEEIEKDAA